MTSLLIAELRAVSQLLVHGERRALLLRAADRITELEDALAWRPIETAPVGYSHPYSRRVDASEFIMIWNGYHQGIAYCQTNEDEHRDWWDETGVPVDPPPTHWRPLGPPPGEK